MATSSLHEFSSGLASLIGRPTDLRPFVCEGSPLECDAFLVGINPATRMPVDFWEFWSDSYGFDKRAWFERYRVEQETRPPKPGRTRRYKVSPTRRIIEEIVHGASPVKCLETDIFAKAAKQASDLEERCRITAPFDYLLRQVAPKTGDCPRQRRCRVPARAGSPLQTHLCQSFRPRLVLSEGKRTWI